MAFKWGDEIFVLGHMNNGERCDRGGRYVSLVHFGPKEGMHQITLGSGGHAFYYIETARLMAAQEYFDRRSEGKLPENAANKLEFVSSEGTKGHLLSQILGGDKDNDQKETNDPSNK